MEILICTVVLLSGTLLVALASLERVWGRPIPRLTHSKPVPKQRVFIVAPILMIAVLIRALAMLPMHWCSHCPVPYVYIIEVFVFAIGLSGGIGFALFLIIWIGCVIWRALAAALHNRTRIDRLFGSV